MYISAIINANIIAADGPCSTHKHFDPSSHADQYS